MSRYRSPWLGPVARFFGVVGVYFAAARLGVAFTVEPEGIAVFWPPAGLLLGYLLLTDRRNWPAALSAAFVATIGANLLVGKSLGASLGFGVANALEPVVGAWVIRSLRPGTCRLNSLFELFLLFGVPIGICAATALLGAAAVAATSNAPFWSVWEIWWRADALGITLFAPLAICWSDQTASTGGRHALRKNIETCVVLALLAVISWGIFATPTERKPLLLALPYPVFPVLLWIAIRLNIRDTAAAIVLVSLIAAWGATQSLGPVSVSHLAAADRILVIQGFCAVVSLSTFLLTVATAERRQREREVLALNEALRQEMAERQSAFENLRTQKQILESILDRMGEAVLVTDPAGGIILENRTFRNLSGAPAPGTQPVWSRTFGVYLPDGKTLCPSTDLPIFRAARGEACDNVEFVLVTEAHPNGLAVSVTGRPIIGPTGIEGAVTAIRDVSAARRAEQELRESELRFRSLVNGIRDSAIFMLDPAGHIASWNVGAERLKGYTEPDVIGKHVSLFSPPEESDKTGTKLRIASEHGFYEEEGWRVRKDGSRFWAHTVISVLHGSAGQILGFAKTTRDLTTKREAERALQRSEERFRAIFDQTLQFIGLMSADGTLLEANRTSLAASGVREGEVLGRKFWDTPWWAHDRPLQEKLQEAVSRATAGATVRFEAHHPATDGGTLWVDFSLKPYIAEGNVLYLIPEGRDITDRKRAELALRESEERFRSAFESAPIGMALVAPDGQWLRVNGALCELLGYTAEELLTIDFQRVSHPDDLATDLANVRRALAGEISSYQMEKRYFHRQGHTVYALLSVSLVRDGTNAPVTFISQIVDISHRKRAEQALAANEALLHQFVTHAPAAIAMLDTEMRYVRTSSRWITDYRLTGQSIIGRSHYDVFPDIPKRWKEIHRRVLTGAIEACPEDPFPRADGGTEWLQWEARPWHEPGGRIGGLIFFTQVITARVEAARRATVLLTAARALAEATATPAVVADLIRVVCGAQGWEVGEFWQLSAAGTALGFAGGWSAPEVSEFAAPYSARTFAPGVGLPGRVWASNRPHVIPDLAADPEFLRQKAAIEHGLRTGIAVPVVVGGRIVGVFVFLTRQTNPPAPEDLALLEELASKFGLWVERKRTETALAESEARFRAVFDASPSGLVLVGRDGRIALANELTHQLFGWEKDETTGAPIERFVPDRYQSRHTADRGAFSAAPQARAMGAAAELTARRKDGSEFPIEIGLTPVRAGGEQFVLASIVNITERRRAEDARRLSEERLRLALENAKHGLWDWDVAGGTVFHDDLWAAVHGYAPGELQLNYTWWEASIHPDERSKVLTALSSALASDNALYDVEYRARRKDGTWVWVNTRGRVQNRDASGKARRMMGTLHDVSARKDGEEELLRSVREKEVMLREIHHRVKNNLAVISSLFHLQAGTVQDPQTAQVLREAQDRVRSMALVHEHLYNSADLGAVAFGEYAKTLATQIIQTYQLPATPIELRCEIGEVGLTIEQAIPCGLILNELLSNSLKHAFRERSHGKVVLSIGAVGDRCEIRVTDDGVGVPDGLDVKLGKSLGVRLIRILTRQLVGSVEYRSPGAGTEVYLTFPIRVATKN
ncbi:MAG TPA: PAS domain S-box protein [Gemmata sp.]